MRQRLSASQAPAPLTPERQFTARLIEAGGNYWKSPDETKRRIYFNEIGEPYTSLAYKGVSDGYFDCISRDWHVTRGPLTAAEFEAKVMDCIAKGIRL